MLLCRYCTVHFKKGNLRIISVIDIFALLPGYSIPRTRPILRYAPCHYLPCISASHRVLLNAHNGLTKLLYKRPGRNRRNAFIPLLPLRTGFHSLYGPTITNIFYSSYTFIRLFTLALQTRTLAVEARHQEGPVSLRIVLLILICAVWKPSITTYIIPFAIIYYTIILNFRTPAQTVIPVALCQRSSVWSVLII